MATIVDGRSIRDELKNTLPEGMLFLSARPALAIIVVGDNPVIEQFIRAKERFGSEAGFDVRVSRFPDTIAQEALAAEVRAIAASDAVGISIELPLPKHISPDAILDLVPVHKDVDVLSREGRDAFALGRLDILPPVVGAISEICDRHGVDLAGSRIVLVGRGRLVGEPVETWLNLLGIKPIVIAKGDGSLAFHVKTADIVISGAGSAHLITPDMVRAGAVLIDAGTSEVGNGIAGDIDPACAEAAKLFVPVPGGIGPLTVFFLYKNVLKYAHKMR